MPKIIPNVVHVFQPNKNDFFCWLCCEEGHLICCELCPRVFHAKCLSIDHEPEGEWVCPECDVRLFMLYDNPILNTFCAMYNFYELLAGDEKRMC